MERWNQPDRRDPRRTPHHQGIHRRAEDGGTFHQDKQRTPRCRRQSGHTPVGSPPCERVLGHLYDCHRPLVWRLPYLLRQQPHRCQRIHLLSGHPLHHPTAHQGPFKGRLQHPERTCLTGAHQQDSHGREQHQGDRASQENRHTHRQHRTGTCPLLLQHRA